MKKIKIGVIGLGEVAQIMHLPALFRLQEYYEVIAVSDISPSLVAHIQDKYHIPYGFLNAEEVINHKEVEAVIVLSPDPLHSAHVRSAVKAKKPVLLEKPACLLSHEAQELDIFAQKENVPVVVAYMRCFTSAFEEMQRQLVDFGEITHVRAFDLQREGPFFFNQVEPPFVGDDCDQKAIEESRKLEQKNREDLLGPQAADLLWKCYRVLTGAAIHNFSVLRNLLGAPQSVVSASYSKGGENITTVLDYGDFHCLYEIVIDNIARVDAYVEVMGEYKSLKLHYDTPYIRNLPTFLEIQTSTEDQNEKIIKGPFYTGPFQKELLHFHEVITKGVPIKTSLSGAVEDIRLAEQIAEKLKVYF